MLDLSANDRFLLYIAQKYMQDEGSEWTSLGQLQYCIERGLILAVEVKFILHWHVIFSFVASLSGSIQLRYWQSKLPFSARQIHSKDLGFYKSQATGSQKRWILELCSYLNESIDS
jgi:hypothetical protein